MKNNSEKDIATNRQLFVDDFWISEGQRINRKLHNPVSQGIVIPGDRPWDKGSISVMGIIEDEGKYRAWYRCDAEPEMNLKRSGHDTAYAESIDGINWEKPDLGLFEINGSRDNNIVWMGPGANLCVFKDPNSQVPEQDKYKGIVRTAAKEGSNVLALSSPDGIHWHLKQNDPGYDRRAV